MVGKDTLHAASLFSSKLQYSADSIESHPDVGGLFALATYQVKQDESTTGKQDSKDYKDEAAADTEDGESKSPAYSRMGSVELWQVTQKGATSVQCKRQDIQYGAAVLDLKWMYFDDGEQSASSSVQSVSAFLSRATADGYVDLFRTELGERPSLQAAASLRINPRKALCLSIDWSSSRMGGSSTKSLRRLLSDSKLIISQSDGTLAYLPSLREACKGDTASGPSEEEKGQGPEEEEEDEPEEEEDKQQHASLNDDTLWKKETADGKAWEKPRGLETWKAHDNEAWIAAWDCWSHGNVAWSGADDLKLKGWDMRTLNGRTGREPTFVTTRCFDGGVTSLQSHAQREHIWAVGSYDSHVRIFDARNPSRPVRDHVVDVEGGVWRVKWHPTDASRLLVGAMHGGFKVLQFPSLSGSADVPDPPTVVKRFDEHESIAYGCDWDRGPEAEVESEERLVFSCSFYDARLHIWRA